MGTVAVVSMGRCSFNRDLIISSWEISFASDFELVSNPGIDLTCPPREKSMDFKLGQPGLEF